jgi:hypothetical protein
LYRPELDHRLIVSSRIILRNQLLRQAANSFFPSLLNISDWIPKIRDITRYTLPSIAATASPNANDAMAAAVYNVPALSASKVAPLFRGIYLQIP